MSNEQLPEYVVLPDITHPKERRYLVVRVKTRNVDGSVAEFEKVDEARERDVADRIAQRLNGQY